jgi:release factor glutamine methyltransferase
MATEAGRAPAAAKTADTALGYLALAAKFLVGRGVAGARLDAELLLAEVLGTDRVGVYLRFDRPLARAEVDAYRALIRRRGDGEPVAHLTGRREFWSRSLIVTPDVLVPRPETELVVERALAVVGARERTLRILDLGTGSGAIAIALASELPSATVVAVDVSAAAVDVARANVVAAGLAARIDVRPSDWTAALDAAERFELVVGNPPYVRSADIGTLSSEVQCEPRLALDGGEDGLDAYRRLVPAAAHRLAAAGALVLEVGAGQAAAVAAILREHGLDEVSVARDLAGLERVVSGTVAAAASRVASS